MAQEFSEELWDINQGPDHAAAICVVWARNVDIMVASMEPYCHSPDINWLENLEAGLVLLSSKGCSCPARGAPVQQGAPMSRLGGNGKGILFARLTEERRDLVATICAGDVDKMVASMEPCNIHTGSQTRNVTFPT